MLVKMYGKLWRVVGTDPVTDEPILELIDSPASPVSSSAVNFPSHEASVGEDLLVQNSVKDSIPETQPECQKIPNPQKIIRVREKQIEKGKLPNAATNREVAGPKLRPDGTTIPEEMFAPTESILDSEFLARAKSSFVTTNQKPAIINIFGEYKKFLGYNAVTGDPIYVEPTAEEISQAYLNDEVIILGGRVADPQGYGNPLPLPLSGEEASFFDQASSEEYEDFAKKEAAKPLGRIPKIIPGAPITKNYGFAGGRDKNGEVCQIERMPLDFKRYGIRARPDYSMSSTAPQMSAAEVSNLRQEQAVLRSQLNQEEEQVVEDIAGDKEI